MTIHGPGRGNQIIRLGKIATVKKGKDIPTPREINTEKIWSGVLVRAKATAVPTRGAEHGVASIVANAPLKKEPTIFTNRVPTGK